MPRYHSHKTVWALQIDQVSDSGTDTTTDEGQIVTVSFKDPRYAPRTINIGHKPIPEPGWYLVQYEDGYVSFSPAEQFEKGNTLETPLASVGVPDYRSFTPGELDNWFSYHAPTLEQLNSYQEIRTAAKIFAETINRHVPSSADKTAAMRELRSVVMASNLAIACYVKPSRPTIAELESILQKEENAPITISPDGSVTTE